MVLSTDYALLSHHPYRGLHEINPHYANPLADYDHRVAYIAGLAGATSARTWPACSMPARGGRPLCSCYGGRPTACRSPGSNTADVGPHLVAVRRS